ATRSPKRRRTRPTDKKRSRSSKSAKRPHGQRRQESTSTKPTPAEYLTGTPSGRRGRPRGSLRAPGRVAVLVWFAREFPIKPSQFMRALGFDAGHSPADRWFDLSTTQCPSDLKAH